MGLIGGELGYRILKRFFPRREGENGTYAGQSKVEALLGPKIWSELAGKVVIDFGCGLGAEAVEIAKRGAKRVVGVDIREEALEHARRAARAAGVESSCVFTTATDERADVVISLDAFEHFRDPEGALAVMRRLLKDDGQILVRFGPTWYHPKGGHLFSVFPWSHLVFTEEALLRWRADFKKDGARRFEEVSGGLNRMTIRRFEELVAKSGLLIRDYQQVPIRRLKALWSPLTRELFTALVGCRLVLPGY